MIPSETANRRAEEVLEVLRNRLAETTLIALIDDPIDAAVQGFRSSDTPIASQTEFLDQLAGFLRYVDASAFPTARQLTPAQARTEAVGLLEQRFPGGYRAALWETKHPLGYGLAGIVAELAALLKTKLRRSHAQWVFTSVVGDLDWRTRCQVAALILQHWSDRKPPELSAASAEQYADHLPLLVQRDLEYRPQSQATTRHQRNQPG